MFRRSGRLVCCLWVLVGLAVIWPTSLQAEKKKALIGGWSIFPPYSDVETVRGTEQWKGFDVELLKEIADRAGYRIYADKIEWADLVQQIARGRRDIAAAATKTPERESFAYFSAPYRNETIVLVMPRGGGSKLPASTVQELVDQIKETGFRLGVETGAAYPSPELEKFLADPANRQQIVDLREQERVPALLNGRIDGFLAERVVAAFNIEELEVENEVEEHPVKVDGKIHLMFSKASVPPEVVADFNRAIEQVQQDRTYRQLNEKYTFPIIVRLTLASDWFFIVDILGTMAFALSGLLLAFRFNYDIFGALVLASLPAVGGGVVRDLITNRGTLAVFSTPIYIEIVLFLVVGGFVVIRIGMAIRKSRFGNVAAGLLERRRRHIETSIQVFDAIGLAAFTVTGVVVAVATQSRPLWLWGPILAAITAAGGGILRDVVRSEPEISVLKGELYPEIALVWGLFLSLFMIWQSWHLNSHEIAVGVAITFFGAFLTRIATIYFGFRSFRFSA